MPVKKDTGFTGALNEMSNLIDSMSLKNEATAWELAPLKMHVTGLRIEHEKLLAMHEQTEILREISKSLIEMCPR